MPRNLLVSFVAALVLSASPAPAARWFVPASAHADGANGTKFRTDLNVVNPTSAAVSVDVTFLPADADNASLPTPVSRTVPAGGQLSLVDVVDALFGRSGGGSLMVESATTGLVVSSRTYNQLPDKTYGLFLPGVPDGDALPANETGHLVFLAKSDVYRSNVGFAGTTGAPGLATVRLFGATNNLLGTATRELAGYGQTQINDVFAAAGADATTVARAEVSVTVPALVYATVIDNRTGDPFALLAQRSAAAAQELVLTAAAHAAGANGSNFRSDVRVFVASDSAGSVTLSFYPRDQPTPSPETRTLAVTGRQLLALDDVLLATFGKDSASGAVRLSSNRPLLVLSRTYNLAGDGSTSGQELPAVPVSGFIAAGDTARLSALSSSGSRTNVIFFNQGAATEVSLALRSATGTSLGAGKTTLPASSMTQINDIFGFLGAPGGTLGFLEVTAAEGGPYWVLATVISNDSNDPFQVAPSIQKGSPPAGSSCVNVSLPRTNVTFSFAVSGANGPASFTNLYEQVSLSSNRVRGTTTSTGVTTSSLVTSVYEEATNPQGFILFLRQDVEASVPGVGSITSTITYNPKWLISPGVTWCAGTTWTIPSVTATTTTSLGGGSQSTFSGNGRVLAVDEPMQAYNGVTYKTVHYTRTLVQNGGSSTQEAWTAITEGVQLKVVSTDSNGSQTTLITGGL